MSTAELDESLPEGQIPPDAGSGSAAPLAVAPDPSGQAAQDDDNEPRGYWVGECGHRVYGGPVWRVGPCGDCDTDAT